MQLKRNPEFTAEISQDPYAVTKKRGATGPNDTVAPQPKLKQIPQAKLEWCSPGYHTEREDLLPPMEKSFLNEV